MTPPSDKAMAAAEEIMVACWNGNPHLRDDSKTWLAGKFDAFAAQAVADERARNEARHIVRHGALDDIADIVARTKQQIGELP